MAGGGGHAPQPKQEELQPHPTKDQLPSISYCITSPPPWRECLTFRQHPPRPPPPGGWGRNLILVSQDLRDIHLFMI